MKFFLSYVFISVLAIEGCKNPSTLTLDINPNYHGWVYLIPVKSKVTGESKIDLTTLGIVYISDSLYNKEKEINVIIKVGDSLLSPVKIRTYNISFYPRNSAYKIEYKKFYFPLNDFEMSDKKDSVYTYKKNEYNTYYLGEFEYYYTIGIIDSNRVIKR